MRSPWTLILLVAAGLVASGCATKGWVNELVGKKEAQADQRFAKTEAALVEVGDGTRAAKGRADEAYGRADEVNGRLTRLWNGRYKRDVVETLHVQFGFDRSDLSDGAQTALLQITKELKGNPMLSVDLEGYTDQMGPREYNVGLSQRRVESVRRFLVGNGADLSRIYYVGLGPLTAKNEQAALQRRVTVRLMINPTD
jgi:outer membrane protein OmpA-like peptidoglycan-associated protein